MPSILPNVRHESPSFFICLFPSFLFPTNCLVNNAREFPRLKPPTDLPRVRIYAFTFSLKRLRRPQRRPLTRQASPYRLWSLYFQSGEPSLDEDELPLLHLQVVLLLPSQLSQVNWHFHLRSASQAASRLFSPTSLTFSVTFRLQSPSSSRSSRSQPAFSLPSQSLDHYGVKLSRSRSYLVIGLPYFF